MTLFWTPIALERVSDISNRIAQRDLETATAWVERLFEAVASLEDFPAMGRKVPELDRENFREIIHEKYRIIYKLERERIVILTVRHGRQLLDETDLGLGLT